MQPIHHIYDLLASGKGRMARGKFISEFERDVIRIGVDAGYKAPQIARFLGRTKVVVYRHIEEMTESGTIGNLPLAFVSSEIAGAIGRAK